MPSTPDLSFQPATAADGDWLFALHERAMRPMVELTYGEWNAEWQRAKFEGRPETDVRIVLSGGDLVGAVRLADNPDGSLYVGLIEIDPAFQSQGLGAAVLQRLATEAGASNRAVTLSVRPTNRAKRLYERVGFRQTNSNETHCHMRLDPASESAPSHGRVAWETHSLPRGDASARPTPHNRGMPQMTRFEKVRTDVRDFREGFRDGVKDGNGQPGRPSPEFSWRADLVLGPLRILVYGFILVSPGVPVLPWGQPAGMLTALAAVAATLRLHRAKGRTRLALAAFIVLCVVFAAAAESVSTSLVLAGAFLVAITAAGKGRPYVYAGIFAVVIGGIVVQSFDLRILGDTELIFSGQSFTPEGAGRHAALLAAVVFLVAIGQGIAHDLQTQKSRAEAAEAARDEAAADERARIARELHDVVSHHVTAMTLQAEAAAATGDKGALASLASSGREASAELRRMLGVLRRPSEDDAAAAAEPQPQLGDIDALARRLTGGLDVEVDKRGRVRALPAGVELCAYRVVQEALTNVAKHSDARRATVVVDYGRRELTLEILDDGRPTGRRAGEGGHGLIGMGERVSLLEGTLQAGEREDGPGYRVFARIPLQA